VYKGNLVRRILFGNIILLLVLGLILIPGCGGGKTTPTTTATGPLAATTTAKTTTPAVNKYGGILKIIFMSAVGPNFGYNTELYSMNLPQAQYALETLVRISEEGVAEPWLATKWEVASDKKTVTIHLREGVKFHDGTDFNAEALVWNINRVIASGSSYHLEWGSGEVIDNYTVKLNLKTYTNRLAIAMAEMMIASPTSFKEKGEKWANDNPTGTGPFKFVSYKKDELLKYERNPNYWQKGLPYLDGIEIRYITDPLTRKAAFENGEAHVVYEIKGDARLDLEKKGYKTPALPAYGGELTLLYVDSGHKDSAYSNIKVRQAMSMALDRNALAQARGFGYWTPATQFAPPKSAYEIADYPDSKAMYNVAKAKQLMAEAGYASGFQTKIYSADSFDKDASVMIQSFLAQIGIKSDIDFLDRAGYTALTNNGWQNGMMVRGVVGMPNFGNIMTRFVGPGRTSKGSIMYPDDYLTALQNSLSSLEIDPALFKEVNRLALDYMLAVPVVIFPPGAQPAWVKEIHDLGLYEQFEWIFNSSEVAWLEKK
jgi:peptide/nickel transport system substrate-binding protein